MPLVSICLPNLNGLRFLKARMESILSQTLTDWELIICDSYSDDGAWEYFQTFKDDPRIRLYQVPREGIYAGWNECLRRVTGEYVYIATADDTCAPELLEKMVGALEGVAGYGGMGVEECGGVGVSECGGMGVEECNDNVRRRSADERACEGESSLAGDSHTPLLPHPLTPPPFNTHTPTPPYSHTPLPIPSLPIDLAVCDFDFIDENGAVIEPPPRGTARTFYGEWLQKPHIRSGYLELLVHLLIDTSWTTITAVVFRRSLLEKVGYFRTDCGAMADKFWAMSTALVSDTVYVPGRLATWRWHRQQASHHLRTDATRQQLSLTAQTLKLKWALLPDAIRTDPAALQHLLHGAISNYQRSLRLDRAALRQHPAQFVARFLRTLRVDPGYALRRCLTGFAWEHEDEHAYVHSLAEQWGVKGPEGWERRSMGVRE